MTDPQRLLKSAENPLAALLLRAATEEKPSAAVLRSTTRAVIATAAAAAAVSAAKTAGQAAFKVAEGTSAATTSTSAATTSGALFKSGVLGVGAVAKWVAIGAVGGAVAMSSVQALIAEQGTKPAPALAAASAKARSSLEPDQRSTEASRSAAELVSSANPKELERPSSFEAQRAQNVQAASGELAKPELPGHTDGAFLAAEVRFVDQGRAALQSGAFAQALEQLTPYERLFPHQQLLTEVLFLRMEASSRLGQVDRARALAARVLTLGVTGRQAAQAREVLEPRTK